MYLYVHLDEEEWVSSARSIRRKKIQEEMHSGTGWAAAQRRERCAGLRPSAHRLIQKRNGFSSRENPEKE